MADQRASQVEAVWKLIYDLLRGPGRLTRLPSVMAPSFSLSASLPDKFDDDLLNKVAQLKQAAPDKTPALIAEIRGDIHVCATTGAIGHEDAEKIQTMLDELEQ